MWYKMFRFIKKMFITVIGFIGLSLNANALKYISINNKECKAKPVIMNINSNEPLFYPYSVIVNQCNGSCNNINNPYAKLCVPDVVKDINIKVFNLMSRTNETRYVLGFKLVYVNVD